MLWVLQLLGRRTFGIFTFGLRKRYHNSPKTTYLRENYVNLTLDERIKEPHTRYGCNKKKHIPARGAVPGRVPSQPLIHATQVSFCSPKSDLVILRRLSKRHQCTRLSFAALMNHQPYLKSTELISST